MVTTLTPTNDTTDRRAAYETAVTTGDRTVIFDGTSGDGTFWMTGRDMAGGSGLTGAKGASIIFRGAPRIEALATSGTDTGLFNFESTSDSSTASTGVSIKSDTKSANKSDWAIIDCNSAVDTAILFNARDGNTFNCVGGTVERVQSIDAVEKGFDLRAGGRISHWYTASTTSSSGANSLQTDPGSNRVPLLLAEHGELGPMPNAANGQQIKAESVESVHIRDISVTSTNANNSWTINFGSNNGTALIQRATLPGGITHVQAQGVLSCDYLLVEDCTVGEGSSPLMGLDRLHNNASVTEVVYRRTTWDGVDRFCFQPKDNDADLFGSLTIEDCDFKTYVNLASSGVRPMLTFNCTETAFAVRGSVNLTSTASNGLIVSTNSTISSAWSAAEDPTFKKTNLDIFSR